MRTSVLVLLLTLGVSTVSGSKRAKRQTDLTCEEDTETLVYTTFLYSNTTCLEKVSEVDDVYNTDYREECQRWLLADTMPHDVSKTYVFECHDFGNGTIKYRAKICCHGKPNVTEDQHVCFTCNDDLVEYEPHLEYYHSHLCNHHDKIGPQICDPGEVCAVQLEYFHNTSHAPDHYALVTKSCLALNECLALVDKNNEFCKLHWTPRCSYCYDSIYGNYHHSFPDPRYLLFHGPCKTVPHDHNTCKWGGFCNETGTGIEDYECVCREGFWGRRCEITMCSYSPCADGAICSPQYAEPYYKCRCHIQWTGYHCNETAPLCAVNWCLNGGTCYIQDGPDERCHCPDGYVGKSCEFEGHKECAGAHGALRTVRGYRALYPYIGRESDQHDCTYWKEYEPNFNAYYARNFCYNHHLRTAFGTGQPNYKPGVHGELAHNQDMWLSYCEQGRDFTWLEAEICCGSCGSNPCLNGGWCIPNKATDADPYGYKCRCRFNYAGDQCQTKLKACYVMGDPHYYTFDGGRFSYQGSCKYTLTQNVAATKLPSFKVTNKNEYRNNNNVVTYAKYAEIEVYGHTIRLAKDLKVYVNGVETNLPYEDSAGRFTIALNGRRARLQTEDNLVVEFYRNWLITVLAPPDAAGKVSGICGDFDGDVASDYILPNGVDCAEDEYLLGNCVGNHHKVVDQEDPNCPQPPPPAVCDEATEAVIKSNSYCGYIQDVSGPFASCISSIGQELVDIYMDNCVYDVCAVYENGEPDRKEAKCGDLSAFAEACKGEAFPASSDWTTTAGCQLECPGDLVYKSDASACLPTCHRPYYDFECLLQNTENCVCPEEDQVALPNNTCVPAFECGCMEEGRELGEVWYSDACDVEYTCQQCSDEADCDSRRPVAKVVETSNPFDPCEGVVCPGGSPCIVDTTSDTCYSCCKCDPKWEGPDCTIPKTYECNITNPCTIENIYFYGQYNEPDRLVLYYAHVNSSKFIQCDLAGRCFEMPCPDGLVFDNYINVCNWPWAIYSNLEGCVNQRTTCPEDQIGDVWYSDDCYMQYQCVECPNCTNPVGTLLTAPYDPCDGVQCPGDEECQVDSNSASCYTCPNSCPCDPKWTGTDCTVPQTYDCNANNPCNNANINFYGATGPQLTYFAHDDPAKYIQCNPFSYQCYEQSCIPGLHFDNYLNLCNWPGALSGNPNGCVNLNG